MGLHRGVRYTGVRCIDALWYIQRSKVFFFNEIGGDIITPNERKYIKPHYRLTVSGVMA